jgi:hypothetical protein|tara:strand:+ start:184 stop:558 length:375 start_codon:yes stop_codon:yes gene_type:complete
MPFFKNINNKKIVWYDRLYNTDYMDGLVDPVDDLDECYLIINNQIEDQGPLELLWEAVNEESFLILMSDYELHAKIEKAHVSINNIEDDEEKDLLNSFPENFNLVRDTERPVHKYKSPKDKYNF